MKSYSRRSPYDGQRYRYQYIEGYLSVVINLLLFISKIVVGLLVHSLSLVADAFHSVSDMATSLIVILSSKVSSKPPDLEHPYGHERFEYVATFAISVLFAVTGVELIREGISRFHEPEGIKYSVSLLLFVSVTVVVKLILGMVSHVMGRRSGSKILKADAIHHYSDAASSLLVLVAIVAYKLGFPLLDSVFASVIGLVLVYTGFTYSRSTMDILIGVAPDKELIDWVKKTAMSTGLIKNIHDVMVHSYGRRKFISFHVEVDKSLTQEEAHEIVEVLRERIQRGIDASITVHVDPVDTESEQVKGVAKVIEPLVNKSDLVKEYHDLRIVNKGEHKVILFDVAAEEPDSDEVGGILKQMELKLKEAYPEYEVRINVDPMYYY